MHMFILQVHKTSSMVTMNYHCNSELDRAYDTMKKSWQRKFPI
jgi:hypothetical protein